jgi:hypothetical protein
MPHTASAFKRLVWTDLTASDKDGKPMMTDVFTVNLSGFSLAVGVNR